jgi:hypothetical protein
MEVHWLGYDIGIVGKVGKSEFVVTMQVNSVAYVKTHSKVVFFVLAGKTYL